MSQQEPIVASPDQKAPYTFHVTKSEVAVDLIAVDARNRSVLNLVAADFEVFDEADGSPKAPKVISNLRLVDPSSTSAAPELPQSDFLGLVQGSCRLTYTAPDSWRITAYPGVTGKHPSGAKARIDPPVEASGLLGSQAPYLLHPHGPMARNTNSLASSTSLAWARRIPGGQ
jgi:hypothetical protein